MKAPECIDCIAEGVTTYRPAPYGGPRSPRCTTHNRAWLKRNKDRAHARHIEANFEITADEYWAIYEAQGGRCPLCLRATGKARRLAIDHDHVLALKHGHDPNRGCRLCIRGLLDRRCNTYGVPLNIEAQIRALEYLHNPPARKVLGGG